MNEKDVLDGNKLIAEFMGAELRAHPVWGVMYFYQPTIAPAFHASLWWDEDVLKYNESWDWLMPVVEKIKQLGFFYRITEWQTLFYKHSDYSGIVSYASKTDIDEPEIYRTWLAVVAFIKYFNSQTLNKQNT